MTDKGKTPRKSRKNSKAEAAAIAEAQAIAQMVEVATPEAVVSTEVEKTVTKTLKSLEDLVVALPEIVIELDPEDVAGLVPDDLQPAIEAGELAAKIRSEAFGYKSLAKAYQDERDSIDTKIQGLVAELPMLKNELRAAQDEWDRWHRALTTALFAAEDGKKSKELDALTNHKAHDGIKAAIMQRATDLLNTKPQYARVHDDLELAKMMLQEAEDNISLLRLNADELKDKANEQGRLGTEKFAEADALLKAAGFDVKERKEVVKSRK